MLRMRLVVAALAAGIVPVAAVATETGTVICKGGIVSTGDSAGEVVAKCGEPATATTRQDKVLEKGSKGANKKVTTISIDDWIFNFGPNQFQYRLVLENGRVARIESLGYGY